MTATDTIRQILANLDTLPDGEAGDDRELSLLRDLRDAVTEALDADAECPRHGGTWGDDETCELCTDEDGEPLPRS